MKKAIFLIFLFTGMLTPAWAQTMLLEKVKGEVQVLKKGAAGWTAAQDKMPLETGDKIKTGDKSAVTIKWEKGVINLEEKTEFGVKEYTQKDEQITTSLELTLGKLKAKVDKLNQGSEFKVTTPTSVAAVRGTFFGLWVYEYLSELFSRLDVWDGIVNFGDLDSDENYDVKGGQYATGGDEGISKPKDEEEAGGPEDTGDPLEDKSQTGADPFDAIDGFQQDSFGSQDNNGNFPEEQPEEEPEKERSSDQGQDDTPRGGDPKEDDVPPCKGPHC